MRILTVSVSPLFPDRVVGGSQRILMDVVDSLVDAGHEVRVLSSRVKGSDSSFQTRGGAVVEPTLELRGVFPAPYQTAPHRLNSVWRHLAEAANWADRAYLHADAVYMRSALGDLPIVRSLHDYVYEEALLSAFTLPADRTIVPSQYVKACLFASVNQSTNLGEIVVIPNGVSIPSDPPEPVVPDGIRSISETDLVLLHPHRLHPEKGIEQSLRIAVEVQKRMPARRVRLLVSALQPDGSSDDAAQESTSVLKLAESLGAASMLELHSWLGTDQMDGYYAAGHVTLCPGSFVEAFGLVPVESVGAGTPAVCARVGALRGHSGIAGIEYFAYGDTPGAATAVIDAATQPFDGMLATKQLAARYDVRSMRQGYVDAITGELSPRPADRKPEISSATTRWRLAPWCYVDSDLIYHDYLAKFESFPALVKALSEHPGPVSGDELISELPTEFNHAKKDGFIVPV